MFWYVRLRVSGIGFWYLPVRWQVGVIVSCGGLVELQERVQKRFCYMYNL